MKYKLNFEDWYVLTLLIIGLLISLLLTLSY